MEAPGSQWVLYVDGSVNANSSGAGLILISPEEDVLQYALRFAFPSNNEAEYEALISCLKISKELGVQHLKSCSDS